jgi:arylformamidase
MITASGAPIEFDQRLDDEYNPSRDVPDYAAYLQAYLDDSARAVASLVCELDVPYGPGRYETLDIFPAAQTQAPLLVFIHGGWWQETRTDSWRFPAPSFVNAGITYVAVNYALAPTVTLDEIVRESRAALAWLARHAEEYGADPGRIHVSGHSAGGHLTAMLLATDWRTFAPDIAPHPISGACAVSGAYDLEPLTRTSVNDALGLDLDAARRNSPLYLIPEWAPELLLAVGGLESPEFKRQQAEFFRAWTEAGLPARTIDMPECNHFNVIQELGRSESPLFQGLLELIRPEEKGGAGT